MSPPTQRAQTHGRSRLRMLKISGQISCCVALLLTLTSVSAVRRTLNSISDLKTVGFGQSVPEYSLRLLHWFANEIDINNDDILLTFDPNSGDYGSHRYHNDEELLDPLPRGYRYYTVGNIYQDASLELPDYVTESDIEESNRVRIIVRVRQQNAARIIDQVYITQHYETYEDRGTEYDPQHTYQVTVCLLRAIRKFSLDRNNITSMRSLRDHFGSSADDLQLEHIRNMWGHLASLGLLFHIVGYTGPVQSYCNQAQLASRRNDSWSNIQDCLGFLCRLFLVAVLFFLLLAAANKK
ncbi:uncharacterized protein LOC116312635 [Oreochromis aureus]|uniref:uncharacterized protein LOC116312635 n=1 Tax=Oreochromis aureus TaxID=47969 RepID=UPI001952FD80|nr:uncharacterized protein LOC116312635 [Oreochromis aureus]